MSLKVINRNKTVFKFTNFGNKPLSTCQRASVPYLIELIIANLLSVLA